MTTTVSTLATGETFRVGTMSGPGAVEFIDVPVPQPGPGEALVRIEAVAICTWEQRSFSGQQSNRFPFVGGHETVGEVVAFGPGYHGTLAVGDRVSLGSAACGACHWCHTGQDRVCAQHYAGAVAYGEAWGPGGFAEMKIHPADGLYPVGDAPREVAALVEPLSCAVHASRVNGVTVGHDVVVLGAGVMGLMNIIAAKAYGARVIASEVDAGRLEMARRMGADVVVDASGTDPVAAVKELTDGRGADVVIAAIGHPSANEQGLAMLADRGSLVLFASAHPETPIALGPNHVHNHEQAVRGVVSSEKRDFHLAARMVRLGLVDLSPLVQATYPLDRLSDALTEAVAPGTYRIVVTV